MNNIILINGPNLNLLGKREQSQYGSITFEELKKLDRFEGRNYFRQFVKVNVDQIHHDAQIYMPTKNMISEEPWDYEKWYKNDMKNFFLNEFDLNGVK